MKAYVDGSYDKDSGLYGYGAVILNDNNERVCVLSGSGEDADGIWNVAGELAGVTAAVNYAINNGEKAVHICYDYEGIEKWATGEWKAKKPATKEYVSFIHNSSITVTFEKVKAHSGDKYNDLADKTAKEAIEFALKTNTSEKAAVTTELTLEGAIHIFENSQLTTRNFSEDAVTATYVKALEGLYRMLPQRPEKHTGKWVYTCPECHQVVGMIGDNGDNASRHCRWCGQAFDWTDV